MDRLLRTVSTMGCCTSGAGVKVTVCGAGGGIGQPLSLMLKKMSGIAVLNLYDVSPMVKGVAADLSHINTPAKITGFVGKELNASLQGVDIVVIPAGVPRKPGMTRDDLFKINAGIICNLVAACAQSCPNAYILIVTNPVNSTVPIAAAVLKRMGCYNPKKLLGVTTLDVVRSNTFLSQQLGVSPCKVNVPVVGGHAGITIIPLFSQVPASSQLSEEVIKGLTNHVMFGGDEVVKAKAGRGSATLSMAHAAAHLVEAILKSYKGKPVTECAFVESNVYPGLPFFASPVVLTPNGVADIPALPEMSAYEQQLTKAAVADLSKQIAKGTKYGQTYNKLPVA